MTNDARFWDKIARKYAAKPVDDEAAYERTLDRTRAHLSPEMSVLELGCGTGTTALKLADAVGRITATDISPGMIEIAREKPVPEGATVDFQVASAETAPPHEDGYDAVLAFNLLHLLDDVPGTVGKIHAMLRPGGVFISKSGALAEASWFLRRLLIPAMQLIGKAPSVTTLGIQDFDRIVAAAGFDILETETFPGLAPTRLIIARKR